MAASIKFDDGSGFASNCFPVRGLFNTNPIVNAEGAWIVAQRAEEKRRFRAILCSQPKTYSQIKEERRRAEKVEKLLAETGHHGSVAVDEEDEEPVLDGFFLMRRCCVDDPTDACSVNLAGLEISEAKVEDLAMFDNVAYVNAAENFLTLETFSAFPIIRELEVPINAIRDIQITRNDFPELEILDLSYNNLCSEDLLQLGLLPKLRVLHLTGNGLASLPPDMAKPSIDDEWYKNPRYASLEILMLDDNRLTETNTFSSLAGLRRLKVLSLSRNEIEYVPQLQLVENNKRIAESRAGTRPRSRPRSGKTPRSARSRKSKDQQLDGTPQRANTPDESPDITKADIDQAISDALADQEDDLPPPFSQLRCIDLSHNKICDEESVLPVALWPLVAELIIHDNPLTCQRSGLPPLLKSLLVDRCGVDVIRKKPDPVGKPAIEVTPKRERRIDSIIPKVPKIPVDTLLALEAPKPREALPAPESPGKAGSPARPELAPDGGSRESQLVRESMDFRTGSRGLSRDSTRSVTFAKAEKSGEDSPIPEVQSRRSSKTSDVQEKPESAESKQKSEVTPEAGTPDVASCVDDVAPGVDDVTIEDVPEEEGATAAPEVDPVFLTQVDGEEADEPRKPPLPPPDVTVDDVTHMPRPPSDSQPIRRRPHRMVVPDRYKGYEALLEEDDRAASPLKEKDVQTCIRALKYALNHPVTVKPPLAPLDKPQPEFTPYKKSVLPPPPVHRTRADRIDSALRKVKNRSVVTEAPLKDALDDKKPEKQKFPEAVQLLAEVQSKYNSVRINSLQDAEDLHSMVSSVIGNHTPNNGNNGKRSVIGNHTPNNGNNGKRSVLSNKSSVVR